jgi:hypothetical protein
MFFSFSMPLQSPLKLFLALKKKISNAFFHASSCLETKQNKKYIFANFLVSFNMFPNVLNAFPNTFIILQHPSCCPPTPFNTHCPQMFFKPRQDVPWMKKSYWNLIFTRDAQIWDILEVDILPNKDIVNIGLDSKWLIATKNTIFAHT